MLPTCLARYRGHIARLATHFTQIFSLTVSHLRRMNVAKPTVDWLSQWSPTTSTVVTLAQLLRFLSWPLQLPEKNKK
jgi:hypothetical protein